MTYSAVDESSGFLCALALSLAIAKARAPTTRKRSTTWTAFRKNPFFIALNPPCMPETKNFTPSLSSAGISEKYVDSIASAGFSPRR